ncbi:MAG: c-type cytochrome [Archangium sp.]
MTWMVLLALVGQAPVGDVTQRGRAIFLDRCSMCHGAEGNGAGPLADDLPLRPRNFRGEPLQWGNSKRSIEDTVLRGRSDVMPSFDGVLTTDEIATVATFVWSIIPEELKRAGGTVPPTKPRPPTSRVYVVRQKGKTFTPNKLQARVGDTVIFVNDDAVDHEVHDLAKPELAIRSQAPRQWDRVVLGTAGTISFGCAIHPSMRLDVAVSP